MNCLEKRLNCCPPQKSSAATRTRAKTSMHSDEEYENARGERVKNRGLMTRLEAAPTPATANAGVAALWSTRSGDSNRQLHDVGYSSGENSVYEALR